MSCTFPSESVWRIRTLNEALVVPNPVLTVTNTDGDTWMRLTWDGSALSGYSVRVLYRDSPDPITMATVASGLGGGVGAVIEGTDVTMFIRLEDDTEAGNWTTLQGSLLIQ